MFLNVCILYWLILFLKINLHPLNSNNQTYDKD